MNHSDINKVWAQLTSSREALLENHDKVGCQINENRLSQRGGGMPQCNI